MPSTNCIACGNVFEATNHRAAPGLLAALLSTDSASSPEAQIEEASRVRCPRCGHIYPSPDARLLGLLSPKAARVVVLSIVLGMLASAILIAVVRS
jgi:DNA-directed RNA polymerase subunit RPC12/RpoP